LDFFSPIVITAHISPLHISGKEEEGLAILRENGERKTKKRKELFIIKFGASRFWETAAWLFSTRRESGVLDAAARISAY